MMNLLSEEKSLLLASQNIVTIRQGSGTYISSSPGMMDDPLGFTFIGNKQKLINDLLEVRFLLEPPIAAMAATRADKKDIKKITTLCDEVEDSLRKHEDHTQKDIDFHAAIAAHDPLRAQDAMYLHLVYNRKRIQMTGKGDFT